MKKLIAGKELARLNFRRPSGVDGADKRRAVSGNVFFALFAAVAMVGAVGYGFNTVLRGPISGMTDVSRRTVAESTVITASRMAMVGATTYQTNGGDCDNDGFIEALPFFDAGTNPKPVGGGYLPRGTAPAWTLVPNSIDPWKTEYGYCAWDSGPVVANVGCGGATGRLAGSPNKNVQAFAIISAGKNKTFETTCVAYNGGTPNASLINKPAGSDDIVLPYTYAEANDMGNGLWTPTVAAPTTSTTAKKDLEVTGGGSFSEPVVMTGGGLVLPGDPGDNSITGPCDAVNDKQLRRNISDPANPSIEICDFTNGMGWIAVSGGGGGGGGGGGMTGTKVSHWKFDETSGTTAMDSAGSNNGTLLGGPTWVPNGGINGGALYFDGVDDQVRVPNDASLRPTAVTVSGWLKLDGWQSWGVAVVSKMHNNVGHPIYHSYGITFKDHDPVEFATGHTGPGLVALFSPASASEWFHVVGTYDPAGPAPQKRMYINGVMVASETRTEPIEYDATSPNGDLLIGAKYAFSYFKGWLDDLRIYNYALSSNEIQEIYTNSRSVKQLPNIYPYAGYPVGWGWDNSESVGTGTAFAQHFYQEPVQTSFKFRQVSPANDHTCGLAEDGTVWCWGRNNCSGKLGVGSMTDADYATPTRVKNLSGIIKVTTSECNSCALRNDGTAWCWGADWQGQLGDATWDSADGYPKMVANVSDFIDISLGNMGGCGVRENGQAWCWGNTALGNGSTSTQWTPVQVSNVTDFVQIAMSKNDQATACGVTKRGLAFCWGEELDGSLGNGATAGTQTVPSQVSNITDFKKVAINSYTGCGLRANGKMVCWGNDWAGQLGNGEPKANSDVPVEVTGISDFIDLTVGKDSACGIRKNGDGWCWGRDRMQTRGTAVSDSSSPVRMMGGPYSYIEQGNGMGHAIVHAKQRNTTVHLNKEWPRLSAGRKNACMIDNNKTIWCWGLDGSGQLGNGATAGTQVAPSAVSVAGPWVQVTVGTSFSDTNMACGLRENGNVYCWGSDSNGGLGNGGGVTADQPSPYLVGTTTDLWTAVSADGNGACGIKVDGSLWCWGSGSYGKTGFGNTSDVPSPAKVDDGPWIRVAAGNAQSCGIKQDGSLWCWGRDHLGQLGDGGTASDKYIPTPVAENGPWIDVSPSNEVTCAVKADGTAWCWGNGTVSRLNGTPQKPMPVRDPGPWRSMSTFTTHICGVKVDGSAWCWGANTNGELGNGTVTAADTPVQVNGGSNWVALDVGEFFTCGIKSDGSAWCWGDDTNGELGNGTAVTADQRSPYPVSLFPKKPTHVWKDNTSYTSQAGINLNIGTSRYISDSSGSGLTLGTAGRSALARPGLPNQLLLEARGAGSSPLITWESASANATSDTITGLVARWRLDETTGTLITDEINGANGSRVNNPTLGAAGKIGTAVTFTAASDHYIRVPRTASIEPSNAITISMWVRRNGAQATSATILSKPYDNRATAPFTSYGMAFNGTSDDTLIASIGDETNVENTLVFNQLIPDNTWTMVTMTYDGLLNTAQMKSYVNGVRGATASPGMWKDIKYDTTANGDLYIGGVLATAGFQRFNGSIDDVRIYNRALNDEEIYEIFLAGTASTNNIMRAVGLDYLTGSLAFTRDTTYTRMTNQWIGDVTQRDLEIDRFGNVGIGTGGSPGARLDVRGAIKVSNTADSCTVARAGTIRYNSGALQYCSGSWKTLTTVGASTSFWDSYSVGNSGNRTGCAIKADGTAWCWGMNTNGNIGNNVSATNFFTPQKVHTDVSATGWSDWASISSEQLTSCGIRTNGTAWCWGRGSYGELGNGTTTAEVTRPVQVQTDTGPGAWSDWVKIDTSVVNVCGIRANGTAWCWGGAYNGRLGNGTTTPNVSRPVQVQTDTGPGAWSDWTQISTGISTGRNCGIRANGTAWCWGDATTGRLGNGTTSPDVSRPVQVHTDTGPGGWSDWIQISAGQNHACGIRNNGTAWCWGGGGNGRLGNGGTATASRPVQVQTDTGPGGWSDWIQISAGYDHTCGVRANGTAWCWGAAASGQTGDNQTATDRTRPVQVHSDTSAVGWTDWVAVAANRSAACGTRSNGTLWCWGDAGEGRLGDGQNLTNRLRPVQVAP